MIFLTTFTNNILPILLLGGAGFVLGKLLSVDPRPLGRAIFYILSPSLVFTLLTQNGLPLDRIAGMMGYTLVVILIVGGIAYLSARLLRLERSIMVAVVITSLFANNGNYGIPLVAFAFGQEAQAYASIYYVTCAILIYTLGVFISSLGHLDFKQAVYGLFKVPAIYAILLAMIFIRTGLNFPTPIERTISLAAGGAVPAMLVLLGLELSRFEWNKNLRAVSIPVVIRLVVAPLVGYGLAALLGLKGVARQAGITQAGMPSAVLTTVLASEYRLESSLITAIVFVSTILSPLTLTPLLVLLGK